MRISDWSSDVCSSDLRVRPPAARPLRAGLRTRLRPAALRPHGRHRPGAGAPTHGRPLGRVEVARDVDLPREQRGRTERLVSLPGVDTVTVTLAHYLVV